jgi:hypothetical protein
MSPYRFLIAATVLGATLALRPVPTAAQSPARVDVTGKWQLAVTTSAGTGTPTLTLAQHGDSLTGHYSSQVLGEADVKGILKGSAITFSMSVEVQGTPIAVTYAGTVETSDSMKGTVDLGGQATGTFTGKRQSP